MDNAFPGLVAQSLGDARFSLLDVGCSGGIDPRWRAFGKALRALAIDASVVECERLAKAETNPDVEYLAAFVSDSPTAKIDLENGQASPLIFKIRDRLSFMRTNELRQARLSQAKLDDKLRHNAWEMTRLADHTRPVVVPELLRARGWSDLDYLKIDIDGSDFLVLKTFEGRLAELGVLGVQLEVNFVGTGDDSEHAFHNTDRFMRRQGYELFRLDVRTYSSRALPARYVWPTPAETVTGRPWQGEAYYARDIDTPGLAPAKRAKLAAIFSAWSVPDAAAELLLAQRDSVSKVIDVDKGLDLLALQAQEDRGTRLGYQAYMRTFESDAPSFYRREGSISLRERLEAAWRAFKRPRP
jgi:Methyltransferase FkbM domain